jgi:hypothetical protein
MFRHPDLTANLQVIGSPLLIAVAARRDDIVNMLLSVGADARLPQNRPAVCLAYEIDEEMAAIFAPLGKPGSQAGCPTPRVEPRRRYSPTCNESPRQSADQAFTGGVTPGSSEGN